MTTVAFVENSVDVEGLQGALPVGTETESEIYKEVQSLRDELVKAQAIIAKVTRLADFWETEPETSYCGGQMRYALGTGRENFIHPSLAAAWDAVNKA